MANAGSAQVSMQFGLKGPSLTHVSACASSSHAIGEGGDIIRRGQADVMVVGGAEATVIPVIVAAFAAMKTLTRRNDAPEAASRPFDKDRDGFVLSEGAAVVVLEEREHARSRGVRVYGELVGYGATADAYHITAPSPEGEGNARAMRMALTEAGLKPEEIDYINAHGTSTQPNDREETAAIKQVFGDHAYKLLVSWPSATAASRRPSTTPLPTRASISTTCRTPRGQRASPPRSPTRWASADTTPR
jgi:3-oxoacyl-[acyl-carrier-protein] synthase II